MAAAGGLCGEGAYPYTGVKGACGAGGCGARRGALAVGAPFAALAPLSEGATQGALLRAPVVAAMDGLGAALQLYAGGVLDEAAAAEPRRGAGGLGRRRRLRRTPFLRAADLLGHEGAPRGVECSVPPLPPPPFPPPYPRTAPPSPVLTRV